MIDLISRQAVIDTLNVDAELLKRALDYIDIVGAEREKFKWGLGLIESYIFDVEELPSVHPERKKGKWIEYIPEHGKCPFCGNQVDLLNGRANNFCSECGADLRDEQDE